MKVSFGKKLWLIGLAAATTLLLQHNAIAQVASNKRTGNELQRASKMRQKMRDMQRKMGEMERKMNDSMRKMQTTQSTQTMEPKMPKIKMRNLNPTFNSSSKPRRRMKIRGLMD
ncbi:MAG: hypothetical protein HQ595_02075 [Candidatus Omnitrophica bacterium]|nr:hypothetical protein [Candidatus Omnitrophota bacterium]